MNVKHLIPKRYVDCALTALVVLYQPLFLYATGIPHVAVPDVLLILFILYETVRMLLSGVVSGDRNWFFCLLYEVFGSFLLSSVSISNTALYRLAMYLFCIAFLIPRYFDVSFGLALFRNFSLVASVFAVIQAIGAYVFKVFIPGTISFLPQMREEVLTYADRSIQNGSVTRVRSFFAEPAHMAIYLCTYLLITLESNRKGKMIEAGILSLAMILSVSSTAYLMMALIWGFYFLKALYRFMLHSASKKKLLQGFIIFAILVIALSFLRQTRLFTMFYDRTFISQAGTRGHLSNYYIMNLGYENSVFRILFGHGFDEGYVTFYLPGVPTLYWRFGYVGLLLFFALILITAFRSKNHICMELAIMFLIFGFGMELYLSYTLMLIMAFVMMLKKDE